MWKPDRRLSFSSLSSQESLRDYCNIFVCWIDDVQLMIDIAKSSSQVLIYKSIFAIIISREN